MFDLLETGTCDTCGVEYDGGNTDDHCVSCGECLDHCRGWEECLV
jgi:hypothetical protein